MGDERVYLTVAEVVGIHHHQIEEYGGEHGLLNQGALEFAVFRPHDGKFRFALLRDWIAGHLVPLPG